ncbi:MAG: L,D-transpeptidase family protein [Acidobacteriota bacterium]
MARQSLRVSLQCSARRAGFIVFCVVAAAAGARADAVGDRLRARIEGPADPSWRAADLLHRFYRAGELVPAWLGDLPECGQAASLLEVLDEAELEGLDPSDYHRAQLRAGLQRVLDGGAAALSSAERADLDLLFTDAALAWGHDALVGRVDPRAIGEGLSSPEPGVDLVELLRTVLALRTVRPSLLSLLPAEAGYARLRRALAVYQELAARGGWPAVVGKPPLRLGDQGPAIAALRRRLQAAGDLAPGPDDDRFDASTATAVSAFERRHGLQPDGEVGAAALTELNVPVERRIAEITANLERRRWLPRAPEARAVMVNAAGFELEVEESGHAVLAMRVVVGRAATSSPALDDRISYLVFNPAWEIPTTLAVRELLPELRRDPGKLRREGIRVLSDWSPDAVEIAPESIDWRQVTRDTFHYRLRQEPGPLNPLGRVKFVFPNHFDVYLHDTPAVRLFERSVRAFSHGCIRIERPIELAEYLLRGNPRWGREAILQAIASGREQVVVLPETVPVHLVYWTAWVDEQGAAQFRRDVYDRDAALLAALAGRSADAQRGAAMWEAPAAAAGVAATR